jgi:hypothetical protein
MDYDHRLEAALQAIRDGSVPSVREAAKRFEIPRSTLQDRLRGRPTLRQAREPQQRLTQYEEEALKRLAYQLSAWGWPITIEVLEEFARDILHRKGDTAPLGQCWYANFLSRHRDLKAERSRTLDQVWLSFYLTLSIY